MFVSQISENEFVCMLSMCAYLFAYMGSAYVSVCMERECVQYVYVQIFTHLYIQQLTSYFLPHIFSMEH